MFDVSWCEKCQVPVLGGICGNCNQEAKKKVPANLRPVFDKEIDFLEAISGDDLSRYRGISLWASKRTYFSNGEIAFKLVGGDLFQRPSLEWKKKRLPIPVPLNRESLAKGNSGFLRVLEIEATSFIQETFQNYSNKGTRVACSFSGGKDSSVIHHLTLRALGKGGVSNLFVDTKIELPETYEFIRSFSKENELAQCSNDVDPVRLWREMLPPSRIIRWCCSVLKTGPYEHFLNTEWGSRRVLTFDGIRADESKIRSQYARISRDTKIKHQTSARPILHWNTFEVWLYLLVHQIPFNPAYELGFDRVGCIVCPFGTQKNDFLNWHFHRKEIEPFLDTVFDLAGQNGLENVDSFVQEGTWKKRKGGLFFNSSEKIRVEEDTFTRKIQVQNPALSENLESLFVPLGRLTLLSKEGGSSVFSIVGPEGSALLEIDHKGQELEINVEVISGNSKKILSNVFKQANKIGYCAYCRFCELICPQQAIKVTENTFSLDPEKCVQCGKCLSFQAYGCFAKWSKTTGGVLHELRST